jgi:serine/threonine-protein kinase
VAEALRVSLDVGASRGAASAEAVDSYMRGRRALALTQLDGPGGAVALFDEALARAPSFTPALAGHAHASLRAWFAPSSVDPVGFADAVARSVERARLHAPDFDETKLAAGIYAVHVSDYAGAGRSLSRALAIAPTFAAAHQAFGAMAVETGRLERGVRHLRAALELDPTLIVAARDLARTLALRVLVAAPTEPVTTLRAAPRTEAVVLRIVRQAHLAVPMQPAPDVARDHHRLLVCGFGRVADTEVPHRSLVTSYRRR